jgi:hypothetical protein
MFFTEEMAMCLTDDAEADISRIIPSEERKQEFNTDEHR